MTASAALHGGIVRGRGVAVWRQLEAWLAGQIEHRAFALDQRLPTETELATRFGVNRHTVRRAIAALAERGLVRVEQGRGTFVQDVVIDYPLRRRTSFSASLIEQDRLPGRELIDVLERAAEGEVGQALGLRRGASVLRARMLGLADGRPVAFGETFLSLARFPDLASRLRRDPSLTVIFRSYGIDAYRRRSTRILARLPTAEEAARLKQAANQPVLVTEAIDVDAAGDPLSFGITCFAAARVQLTVAPDGE
jgi:GntR family phosphonate transport system transcriptional regulator